MQIKVIQNTNGVYTVSDEGNVYKNGVELKYGIFGGDNSKTGGYKAVSIKYTDGWKLSYVHRLVAEAFIPNTCPDVSTCINHKNENKLLNNVSNLEWVTKRQNSQLSTRLKTKTNNGSGSIKTIAAYNTRNEMVGVYDNIKSAAVVNDPEHWKSLKTSINFCILDPVNHRSSRGYIWKRIDKELFAEYKESELYNKKLMLFNIRIRERKPKVYKPRRIIELYKNGSLEYKCNTFTEAAKYLHTYFFYIKERALKNLPCKGYDIKITEL